MDNLLKVSWYLAALARAMSFKVAKYSSSNENGKMNCTQEEHPSLSAQNIVLAFSLFRSQLSHSLQIRLENTSNSSSPLLDAGQPPSPPENGNAVCGRQMISVDIRHISADRLNLAARPHRPGMPASLLLLLLRWQTRHRRVSESPFHKPKYIRESMDHSCGVVGGTIRF